MSISRRHILRASLTAAGVMILPGRSLADDEPGVGDVHDIVNVAYGTPPGEAREELELSDNPPTEAFKAWDEGDHEFALDLLQKEVEIAADDPDRRDLLRKVMVGYFTELGPTSELAATHRRRLATFF